MIERRDEELSYIYRDAEGPRPPQRVDDNILAASQRVASTIRRPAGFGFSRRWGTPVALAATVLVTFTLALMVFERESGLDTMAPKAPRAGRPAKASLPEPQRAESPEKPSLAEAQRADLRPGERAAPAASPGAGPSAYVPEVPRTHEILRKREEANPSPAAAAPAEAGERTRAAQPVPDAQRVFEAQQPIRPAQAPAAAPAPGANTLRESGSLQGAGAAGALASRVAASDATERTPEKWLEDIRKLKTEGRAGEAERELAEFRKRYPDYRLPEDLR